MPLSNSKKQELFDYYSENGFQNSTEQIVKKMNICHKTFFNRYGTKANSVEIAWLYWQQLCRKKWLEVVIHCNHSIEALTMTLFNISEFRNEEPHYYEYTRANRKYLEKDSFFYTAIHAILERGKQSFHIQENLDFESYITFLLNNLFLIDAELDQRPAILNYVLAPALTERGLELFLETPFAWH